MELKLPIYNGKEIVKTYTAETINCSFGVIEDILDALNFDSMKTGDKVEVATMIVKCTKQLKPFLMDVFEGVTPDEIRHTKMNDLVNIFKSLYEYATGELTAAAGDSKN